jgi:hypothetical protein
VEILTILGGWAETGPAGIRVQWTDPTDPRPPVDRSLDYWDRWQARHQTEKEALRLRAWECFEGEPGIEAARREALIAWAEDRESEADPTTPAELAFTRRWLKASAQARRELEAAEVSRERTAQVWFNGEAMHWELEVNRERTFEVKPVQGENRLELLDPATGERTVRTWWCGSRAPRLRVVAREPGQRWPSWNLAVLEPGGELASDLQDFERTHPAPGTYTLRWNARTPSPWWSLEDASPRIVQADVTLDGGTDRERRWHFESLVLPGSGTVVLGSFDVES